jgi:hypothetical protein
MIRAQSSLHPEFLSFGDAFHIFFVCSRRSLTDLCSTMALFESANCDRNATAPTASDAGVAGAGVSFNSNVLEENKSGC